MPTERRSKTDASSAYDCVAITPADADLTVTLVGIYVGVGGNVVIKTPGGSTITFVSVPQGTFMPVRAIRVTAATAASSLVGLY